MLWPAKPALPTPIRPSGLRLEVTMQPDWSAGIEE